MQSMKIGLQLIVGGMLLLVVGTAGAALGGTHSAQPAAAAQAADTGGRPNAPIPQPTRKPYVTRTSADVLRGLATDPFWTRQKEQAGLPGPVNDPRVATGQLGEPVQIRGLRPGSGDGWLVPVVGTNGQPVAAVAVSEDASGMGLGTALRGWPYTSFPAVSEASARAKGALPGEAVQSAVLMWAEGLGRPSNMVSPFWRVTSSSGNSVFVFEDGSTAPASNFGAK